MSSIDEKGIRYELDIDSEHMGNESRFLNDYRGEVFFVFNFK